MKNIHVLPTDKPSTICKVNNVLVLSKIGTITNDTKSLIRQNICITSESEDIKDNTWVLNIVNGSIYKTYNGKPFNKDSEKEKWRKIILTTDQDLINDGVQDIDDEFLEWFVKNPSCEEVEVEKDEYFESIEYDIIIPKEVEKRKTNKTKKMKNYKVEIFDENTFKSKGIVDTKIPEILVKTIQESLNNLNENLVRTPLVLNEEELTPSFGIMVKDKKGLHHLKYRVNISLFNKPKKIKK